MEFWSVCPSRLLFWGEGYTFLFLCWLMECGCYCFSPLTRRATLLLASFSRCKDTARMLYHTNTNIAFTYKFVTFVTFLRIHTYKKRFICPPIRQIIFVYPHDSLQTLKSDCASHFDLALMEINIKTKCEAQSLLLKVFISCNYPSPSSRIWRTCQRPRHTSKMCWADDHCCRAIRRKVVH